jgi:hypothetical protein
VQAYFSQRTDDPPAPGSPALQRAYNTPMDIPIAAAAGFLLVVVLELPAIVRAWRTSKDRNNVDRASDELPARRSLLLPRLVWKNPKHRVSCQC